MAAEVQQKCYLKSAAAPKNPLEMALLADLQCAIELDSALGNHLVLENGEGAADLGLAKEEDRVAVHEGEELLHQVRVEEELLLKLTLSPKVVTSCS